MTYFLFKFLHVASAIIWVGGTVMLALLNLRLAGAGEQTVLAAMSEHNEFLGARVVGPAAGLTLLTGIVAMIVGGLAVSAWIVWGVLAMVLSGAIGGSVLRRSSIELGQRLANGESGAEIAALQKRMRLANGVNVLLLLSAVWAMVFKPTL